MEAPWSPWIGLLGFGTGLLVGLTGTGGGSLATPLLILLGVRPAVAVGTGLLQMALTKGIGAWQHWRQGTVDPRLALLLAGGSIPGALAGARLLARWASSPHLDALVQQAVGAMLVVSALSLLLGLRPPARRLRRAWPALLPLGFGVGFLVAWTSVGSGALLLALLVALVPGPLSRLVGTDVLHGFLLSLAAGLGHLFLGTVEPGLALNFLMGSLPGVVLGSRLAPRVPEGRLRVLVGATLLGLGVRLL